MKNLDHIGIAIKDQSSTNVFNLLLNKTPYKEEVVGSEKVKTLFYKLGNLKIELLEPLGNQGPIAKFLKKNGEGLHHLAFNVDNIFSEIARLKKSGVVFVDEIPKRGADNKLICFIHPKSTNGVLVELCQNIK